MAISKLTYGKYLPLPFCDLSLFRYLDSSPGKYHNHPFVHTIIILKGELVFRDVERSEYHCLPGTLLSVPAKLKHIWFVEKVPSETLQIGHIPVTSGFYSELSRLFGVGMTKILKARLSQAAIKIADGIIYETTHPGRYSSTLIHGRLLELFAFVARETGIEPISQNREEKLVADTMDFVHLHFRERLSIASLAERVNLSPSRFSHVFSSQVGKSPLEYINEQKIEYAKALLQFSPMNVSETAEAAGFESLHYFSRLFKKLTGVSPRQYAASGKPAHFRR